jgi:predicted nucleic acid-binding protein
VSLEFLDTNVLVYAHSRDSVKKRAIANDLIGRTLQEGSIAVSTQVLAEFYSVAIHKLAMSSEEAETVVTDFGKVQFHQPSLADLIRAAHLHRRYKIQWWDALIVNSALELGCSILWTEDLRHGQRIGGLTVRNPFA